MQPFEPIPQQPAVFRDYDPLSPTVAEAVLRILIGALPLAGAEHIGSTAVQDCPGKGYIDILVTHADRLQEVEDGLVALGLQKAGAEHARFFPPDRPVYRGRFRFQDNSYVVIVHVLREGNPEARRFLFFKNRLIGRPDLLERYVALKREIVSAGIVDTNEYTVRKHRLIDEILAGSENENK